MATVHRFKNTMILTFLNHLVEQNCYESRTSNDVIHR